MVQAYVTQVDARECRESRSATLGDSEEEEKKHDDEENYFNSRCIADIEAIVVNVLETIASKLEEACEQQAPAI